MDSLLSLTPIAPFDFHHAVTGHGWYQLAPYRYDESSGVLSWPQRLPDGGLALVRLCGSSAGESEPWLRAEVDAPTPLSGSDEQNLAETISWVINAERDLRPFYELAARVPGYEKAIVQAQGRFLRSPSLFEDFVKVICTTNTTWSQTKGMVRALVAGWGEKGAWDSELAAFPTAAVLAQASEGELRTNGRLGYRAPYVLELAQRVVSGELDLNAFRQPDWPTPKLRKALLGVKGIGPYAAATLLTLLGHFDHLAVDSWTRKLTLPRFFPDREDVTDAEIIAVYADWHPYQQLAYWFYDWEEVA